MKKHDDDPVKPTLAGGCCCSGKKDSAQVAEAGVESFLADDPPDWTLGREEPESSCCQSSKGTVTEKGERE